MRSQIASPVLVLAVPLAALLLASCTSEEVHRGHGVVEQVMVDEGQVVIAHDDIPGFMMAMTMNFAIYDAKLLATLSAGDVVDFDLTVTRGQFYITAATVVGKVDAQSDWVLIGDKAVRADSAPSFSLIDQAGKLTSLEDLRGRTVLLDFIFTRCPGPCPILTSTHVSAERLLSPELRARTHFVSISIDPLRDTQQDMRSYGEARGADLDHWSFLTGPPSDVESVVAAYGIGTTRSAEGELEHVVASFLIDPRGRIVKRYLGLDHEPGQIAVDLESVAVDG
jgi:protein SCO1/2